MHLVIASFAIVILAIAILFSNRYEFIGSGKDIYRLDNFTGKIEKIEGSSIIKLDKKLSIKHINEFRHWKEYSDKNITAVLETKYVNETLFIKLLILPNKQRIDLKTVTISFFDKDDFLLASVDLDKRVNIGDQLVFFGSLKLDMPFYMLLNYWQVLY